MISNNCSITIKKYQNICVFATGLLICSICIFWKHKSILSIWKKQYNDQTDIQQDNSSNQLSEENEANKCDNPNCACDIGMNKTKKNAEQINYIDDLVIQHDESSTHFKDDNNEFLNPETFKYYIKTYGCTHNTAESEMMHGLLSKEGFVYVDNYDNADFVIINSCTVKNPSQDSAINLTNQLLRTNKKIIFCGCVIQAQTNIKALENISCVGISNIQSIVEAAYETLKGNVYKALEPSGNLNDLNIAHIRKNALIEIIPISNGCLGNCTYCKTKFARGSLISFPIEAILNRIRNAILTGCQQIWLTSEDTGAWGLDIGLTIVDLLRTITNFVQDNESQTDKFIMLRIGMTNPPYILNNLDEIAEIFQNPHWFKFLHIPVQSGSTNVLKNMNREYTIDQFKKCVDAMIQSVPNITIATDFICGFAGETQADHNASLELINKYMFPIINISQFYSRPNTPAAKMKKLNSSIVKARSTEMTKLFNSYTTFDKYVGCTKSVWIVGTSEVSEHFIGHTQEYVKVLISTIGRENIIGTTKLCRINKATKWHLEAEIIE